MSKVSLNIENLLGQNVASKTVLVPVARNKKLLAVAVSQLLEQSGYNNVDASNISVMQEESFLDLTNQDADPILNRVTDSITVLIICELIKKNSAGKTNIEAIQSTPAWRALSIRKERHYLKRRDLDACRKEPTRGTRLAWVAT